jgi:hypothetical protein
MQLEIPAWAIRVNASGEVTQQFADISHASGLPAARRSQTISMFARWGREGRILQDG